MFRVKLVLLVWFWKLCNIFNRYIFKKSFKIFYKNYDKIIGNIFYFCFYVFYKSLKLMNDWFFGLILFGLICLISFFRLGI